MKCAHGLGLGHMLGPWSHGLRLDYRGKLGRATWTEAELQKPHVSRTSYQVKPTDIIFTLCMKTDLRGYKNFSRARSPGITQWIEGGKVWKILKQKTWCSVFVWSCCNFKFRRTGEKRTSRRFTCSLKDSYLEQTSVMDRKVLENELKEQSTGALESVVWFHFSASPRAFLLSQLTLSLFYILKTLSLFQAGGLGYENGVERKKRGGFEDILLLWGQNTSWCKSEDL